MPYANVSLLHLARVSFAPLLAMVLSSGLPACGGNDGTEGGSGGKGASAGGAGVSGSGAANGGNGATAASGGTNGVGQPSGEPCAKNERAGTLALRLTDGKTILEGAISNGASPVGETDVASEGLCRLVGPAVCATTCASGTVCVGNDVCMTDPTEESAGKITVTGLLTPLELMVNGITGTYSKTIVDPYPAFEPGAAIQLSAAGDTIPAFNLHGWGVPQLVVTTPSPVNVSSGSGVPLTWETTGVNPEQSEVFINFEVNVHGAATGHIECTVPDTGSYELPETLVTDLVDRGLSGFPRMEMIRRSVDSTELAAGNCVEFEVGTQVTIELTVDGLVSCSDDLPCPEGQTCTPELTCE
jgi:hypothetical protein